MPLERLYEICDNEDTPELKERIEIFEKRIEELLHNNKEEAEVEQLFLDAISIAQKQGFVNGFKCALSVS